MLAPGGTLEVLDLQPETLDHTTRRAGAARVANVAPTRGDAQALPYADESLDAAYLNLTVGEVSDQAASP